MTLREDAPRLKGIRHILLKVAPEPPGRTNSRPGRITRYRLRKSPLRGIKVVPRSKPFVLSDMKGFWFSGGIS